MIKALKSWTTSSLAWLFTVSRLRPSHTHLWWTRPDQRERICTSCNRREYSWGDSHWRLVWPTLALTALLFCSPESHGASTTNIYALPRVTSLNASDILLGERWTGTHWQTQIIAWSNAQLSATLLLQKAGDYMTGPLGFSGFTGRINFTNSAGNWSQLGPFDSGGDAGFAFNFFGTNAVNFHVNTAEFLVRLYGDGGGLTNLVVDTSSTQTVYNINSTSNYFHVSKGGTLTVTQALTLTPYTNRYLAVDGNAQVVGTNNGVGWTNLNASNLASGTVADARLSANVPLLNAANVFTASNNIPGAFTGNGSGLTNLNASNLASGTVGDARLSANVPLLNAANVFSATNRFVSVTTDNSINIGAANTSSYLGTDSGRNAVSVQPLSSITIPMGAFFTNNLSSPASSLSVSNVGDGFAFSATATNAMRTRFAMPADWDSTTTILVNLRALCTGTNATGATATRLGVRVAQEGDGSDASNPSFNTATYVTNSLATNSWVSQSATTSSLTINSASVTNSFLWEVFREGGGPGDTETNANFCLTEMRVLYVRKLQLTAPF